MISRPSSPLTIEGARKKLLVDEKVEVRSVDDGFLGSWHSGIVIGCLDSARVVRYDHILNDEGFDNLTEPVKVSPIVDGVVIDEIPVSHNYRSLIRPLQPSCELRSWCPHYGQCVEFYYEDAWWEGAIIDHEERCEKRRVFFPDLGDEMVAGIDMLRLSRDWDEATEEWKPRGNWLFLELIEEVEKDWPIPVSVRQIWYEVRMKNGFEKLREWTSSEKYIWRELVIQVLLDNIRITVKQLFVELNSSWNLEELGQSLLEYSEPALDALLKTEGFFHSSLSVVPFEATFQNDSEGILPSDRISHHNAPEQNDQASSSTMFSNEQSVSIANFSLPILSHSPDEYSVIGSKNYKETPDMSCKLPHMEPSMSTQNKSLEWQPILPEMISGTDFCPNAIEECTKMFRLKKRPSHMLRLSAKKQLLHLGWKIEQVVQKAMTRQRYFSPDGKLFDSLPKACMEVDCVSQDLGPGFPKPLSPNINRMSVCSPEETRSPPLAGKSHASSKRSKMGTPDKLVIEPDYCPDAVRHYYLCCQTNKNFSHNQTVEGKLRAMKAKRHLSAIGWSFYYHKNGEKKKLRYASPSGTLFCSLLAVCKWCIEASELTSGDPSPTIGKMGNVKIIKDFNDHFSINNSNPQLLAMESLGKNRLMNENTPSILQNESSDISMSKGIVPAVGVKAYKVRSSRKKRKHDKSCSNEGSRLPKRRKRSRGSMKSRRCIDSDSSIPVRRSKRVRDIIASPCPKTPRTVLSWLIDNNIFLPRARVYYYNRNNGPPLAEGRVGREGIKCGCCGEIFSLCKFEAHAGSTNHRPSANIFLEDGRSLLQCQLQLKKRMSNRVLGSESCEMMGRRCNQTNDYICSICHYGGELVLCDQCPSSYHTRCLGLKEVPEGDWFCPSCCCQVCGQKKVDDTNEQDTDSVRICGQCEKRYHVECLRNKAVNNRYEEEHWFCGDTCQQIFCFLRKIMGKPHPVGTENLTWTLVKYTKSESYDRDVSDDECLVENFSKLNVALSVMHECFEPVQEPSTRRDLVEDLIFSRWSELNRLNFQGFYTVLLEKDDELISAATVRIYGKRVAEVPLVATRFQYRRLGMCRILMDELEKKLAEMGVEKLVLPAVPSVLNTWTTSFGFSAMNEAERLKFLDFALLNFQGAVFCQKDMTSNPSSVASSLLTETQATSSDYVNKNVNINLDGNSTASEDFHGEVIEEVDIVKKGSTSATTRSDNENGGCSAQLAIAVDQSIPPSLSPLHTTIPPATPLGVTNNKNHGVLKCYKRRKLSTR